MSDDTPTVEKPAESAANRCNSLRLPKRINFDKARGRCPRDACRVPTQNSKSQRNSRISLAFRVLSKDSGSCRLIDGSNAPSQGADATSARRTLSVSWLKISAKN